MTPEDILNFFYEHVVYKRSGNGWATPFDAERMRGVKLAQDLVDAKTGEAVAEAGQKITPRLAKKLVEGGLKQVFVTNEQLVGSYISADFIQIGRASGRERVCQYVWCSVGAGPFKNKQKQ